MTLNEALEIAEKYKKSKEASEIIELLTPFWNEKVTTAVGALLAYAYRRLLDYNKCLEICDTVDKVANYPAKIKAQRQWCLVFRDIVNNEDTEDANKEALQTISYLNINNSYEFVVFKFICLVMANRYAEINFSKTSDWFDKVPSVKLNNKSSSITEDILGEKLIGRSDKFIFYRKLVDYLLEYGELDSYLDKILVDFNLKARAVFSEAFMKNVTGESHNGGSYIKKQKLATLLMLLKESSYHRQHCTVKITDSLKMSDVSAYVFCPVSAIISKTLVLQEISLEHNEYIAYSKKYINDYFDIIKNTKIHWETVLSNALSNTFTFSQNDNRVLSRIFRSHRLALNSQVGSSYLSNIFKKEDILLSPDMVLEENSDKFCVEEVFTSRPVALVSQPFDNDRIKVIGYLQELNIKMAYLIYWNITYEGDEINPARRTGLISGMKIFEIRLEQPYINIYFEYKNKIKQLIASGGQITPSINYNKCLGCSVMHYCIHKYGNTQMLLYPYKLNLTT